MEQQISLGHGRKDRCERTRDLHRACGASLGDALRNVELPKVRQRAHLISESHHGKRGIESRSVRRAPDLRRDPQPEPCPRPKRQGHPSQTRRAPARTPPATSAPGHSAYPPAPRHAQRPQWFLCSLPQGRHGDFERCKAVRAALCQPAFQPMPEPRPASSANAQYAPDGTVERVARSEYPLRTRGLQYPPANAKAPRAPLRKTARPLGSLSEMRRAHPRHEHAAALAPRLLRAVHAAPALRLHRVPDRRPALHRLRDLRVQGTPARPHQPAIGHLLQQRMPTRDARGLANAIDPKQPRTLKLGGHHPRPHRHEARWKSVPPTSVRPPSPAPR